jgi:hypothetical protein
MQLFAGAVANSDVSKPNGSPAVRRNGRKRRSLSSAHRALRHERALTPRHSLQISRCK